MANDPTTAIALQGETADTLPVAEAPAHKLKAEDFSAEDFDGVTETASGSGQMNYLVLQTGQTQEMQNIAGADSIAATPFALSMAGGGMAAAKASAQSGAPHAISADDIAMMPNPQSANANVSALGTGEAPTQTASVSTGAITASVGSSGAQVASGATVSGMANTSLFESSSAANGNDGINGNNGNDGTTPTPETPTLPAAEPTPTSIHVDLDAASPLAPVQQGVGQTLGDALADIDTLLAATPGQLVPAATQAVNTLTGNVTDMLGDTLQTTVNQTLPETLTNLSTSLETTLHGLGDGTLAVSPLLNGLPNLGAGIEGIAGVNLQSNPLLADLAGHADNLFAATQPLLSPLLADTALGGLAAQAGGLASSTLAQTGGQLTHALNPALDSIGEIAQGLTQPLAQTLDTVAQNAAPLVEPLSPLLEPLTGGLANVQGALNGLLPTGGNENLDLTLNNSPLLENNNVAAGADSLLENAGADVVTDLLNPQEGLNVDTVLDTTGILNPGADANLNPLVENPLDMAGDTLDTVADTLAGTLSGQGGPTDALGDTLDNVTDLLGDDAGGLSDTLDGLLGGTDPNTPADETDLGLDAGGGEILDGAEQLLDPAENLLGDVDIDLGLLDDGNLADVDIDTDLLDLDIDEEISLPDIAGGVEDTLENVEDILTDPSGDVGETLSDLLGGDGGVAETIGDLLPADTPVADILAPVTEPLADILPDPVETVTSLIPPVVVPPLPPLKGGGLFGLF